MAALAGFQPVAATSQKEAEKILLDPCCAKRYPVKFNKQRQWTS